MFNSPLHRKFIFSKYNEFNRSRLQIKNNRNKWKRNKTSNSKKKNKKNKNFIVGYCRTRKI